MIKLNVWSSAAGLIGVFFLVAGIVGAVLQFIKLYLPAFQNGFFGDPWDLIFFIISIGAMALLGLMLIMSIIGSPRVLWIIVVFLGLACVLVPPIVFGIDQSLFLYTFGPWYTLNPIDFIGFWIGAGGALIATIFGIFIPAE